MATQPALSPPSPALVNELSASCIDYVQRATGVELDFTSDTLSLLDHYLTSAGAEARQRPQALALIARVAAAYFGETLRHRFDCWWSEEGDDVAAWQIRFGPVYLELSPFALVAEALGLNKPDPRPTPGVPQPEPIDAGFTIDPDDIEYIGAHLAALPSVPEDEYVLLSTRFDTLEIVFDQLKARAAARGLGDVLFEDPDYEDA